MGRPCLIDWKAWDIEPGTNDLAALIAVRWYPDLREYLERPLPERYHRRLQANGVAGYGWDECWNDDRLAVVRRMLNPHSHRQGGRPAADWRTLTWMALRWPTTTSAAPT